ncbi:MarR family winged helix-turn-helix transcriptional regulator [Microbacterium sp. LRZ72]|uniref:MarR family winged helix-turn-helix transcriptional regulator n=1 Tax=Microbacterium sp. LRZ72 TaxID=2942481 RepID=UPI0029B889D7|nr:MarR family winged helix-turn-helix transcriptional regulator [Microbacterium sp. LRZ72]MDX2377528.1 MarR family winged helix-turn-helix transcriptional regulator [Microbacterium sp. LRZ72]
MSGKDEFARLADVVIDVAREMRIRAGVAGPGVPLTQAQSAVMRHVHRNPRCTPSQIAAATGLLRANVSRALGDLRRLGYVVTTRGSRDARTWEVAPTELAEGTIAQLREAWGALLAEAWAGRPTHELARTRALLEDLHRAMAVPAEAGPDGRQRE